LGLSVNRQEKIMEKLAEKIMVITGGNNRIGLTTANVSLRGARTFSSPAARQSQLDAAVKQIGKKRHWRFG
jgi:NADP-dependent 3-hydroxy acid dehydrogenase YdfG